DDRVVHGQGEITHRQRGGVGGDDRPRCGRGDLPEGISLEIDDLRDRLNHQGVIGEGCRIGAQGEAFQPLLHRALGPTFDGPFDVVGDVFAGGLDRGVVDVHYGDMRTGGEEGVGDTRTHPATTKYAHHGG